MLPPPHPIPAARKAKSSSPAIAIQWRRRDGTPSTRIPANIAPPLAASQPSRPGGRTEADMLEMACGPMVETVRVALAVVVVLLSGTEVGFIEQVISGVEDDGMSAQERFTVPAKPFFAVTEMVEVPEPPGAEMVMVVGFGGEIE